MNAQITVTKEIGREIAPPADLHESCSKSAYLPAFAFGDFLAAGLAAGFAAGLAAGLAFGDFFAVVFAAAVFAGAAFVVLVVLAAAISVAPKSISGVRFLEKLSLFDTRKREATYLHVSFRARSIVC